MFETKSIHIRKIRELSRHRKEVISPMAPFILRIVRLHFHSSGIFYFKCISKLHLISDPHPRNNPKGKRYIQRTFQYLFLQSSRHMLHKCRTLSEVKTKNNSAIWKTIRNQLHTVSQFYSYHLPAPLTYPEHCFFP